MNICTAFAGLNRIASGSLPDVIPQAKAVLDQDPTAQILIFDNVTSELIEVDFRAPPTLPAEEPRRAGRPKLGVVAREVTLLPRHWDWLAEQPGGASVALRKLVEQARQSNAGKDRVRRAQESAYRFMSAMAGNEPGFEEAIRALFAGNLDQLHELIACWPPDIRDHAKALAYESKNR